MRKWPKIIVGLLLLAALPYSLGCMPLMITEVKVSDYCLSWTTSKSAVCKVAVCKDSKCMTSDIEPEPGKLHCFDIQPDMKKFVITAYTDSETVTQEVTR
jgi:hypothetical protein